MTASPTAAPRIRVQNIPDMVLKIALIFALTDCSKMITFDHLRKAIAFLESCSAVAP